MASNDRTALHIGDTVEEAATKRRGNLDEAPRIPTDVRRWRVIFADGGKPPLKYFTNEADITLISCPHGESNKARFVPERGITGHKQTTNSMGPIDEFLNAQQEGHVTKIEPEPEREMQKKDDELPRLGDPSKASAPPPMGHKVEELDDEGDILGGAVDRLTETDK